jgi:hypothetical protein
VIIVSAIADMASGNTQQTDAQGLPLGLDKTLNNVVGGTGLLK